MEKSYVIVQKEELKESEEAGEIPNSLLSWIFKNIKFLLLPGSRLEELTFRELEFEKAATKRHFFKRLLTFLVPRDFSSMVVSPINTTNS